MPHHRSPLVLTLALVGACAGPYGSTPEGLAYRAPDPNPATYTFTDTAVFTIETAMGPMEVVAGQAGTAELDFRRWARSGRVVVRFPHYRGSFRNLAQRGTTVTESAMGGPFTVRLTAAGAVAVVDTPAIADALLEITGPEALLRPLFVHLPARPVRAGARWVDTVRVAEEVGETRSVVRSVTTSTMEGDTVVAGRRLLVIGTESVNTVEVTGESGGVAVEQRLMGTTRGRVLWDDAAHVMVERSSVGVLTGTLALPSAEVEPMPVRAAIRRFVTLRQ